MPKIDNRGKYLPFRGITVIAMLKKHELINALVDVLSSDRDIRSYYAFLPTSCFHMTTNNLFVEAYLAEDTGHQNWEAFIDSTRNLWQRFSNHLMTDNMRYYGRIIDITTNGAIQLVIDVPPEIKETIQNTGREFNVAQGIPDPFHITLAYQYQAAPKSIAKKIKDIVDNMLKLYNFHYFCRVYLHKPTLCLFNDMTQYQPWDGINNPFQQPLSPPRFADRSRYDIPFFQRQNIAEEELEETKFILDFSEHKL